MAGSRIPGPVGLEPDGAVTTLPRVPDAVSHYDVRRGDSLWSIARRQLGEGYLYLDLARLNRRGPGDVLRVGQRLIVPNYQRCDLTVEYMLSEMATNSSGEEAKAIRDALERAKQYRSEGDSALADIKNSQWFELFRIYGDQKLFEAMVQQAGIAMTEAKARWFLQVRAGGPWDHKPILKKMYETMGTPPRPFGSLGRAFHFPIRDDLFHEYYYDIWSNIHYGYVGSFCGFDEATLQGGAASGLPGAGGNDEGDIVSVKIGIDLWKFHGSNLTAGILCKAIVSNTAAFVDARRRELANGTSADRATNVVIVDNDYK